MDFRGLRGLDDIGLRRAGAAIRDVIADGVVEQNSVLRHDTYGVVQRRLRHVAHVLPVDADRPSVDVIEPE